MKQQNKNMMPADQVNEIVGIYTFEFARAKKGNFIWDEFRRFIRSRAEKSSMLSLNTIAHYAYVLVSRNMVDEHQVWNYLTNQVNSILQSRNLSQDQLDIENVCMIIASFQASSHLTPDLQRLILSKV
jgi:hypothetical protein